MASQPMVLRLNSPPFFLPSSTRLPLSSRSSHRLRSPHSNYFFYSSSPRNLDLPRTYRNSSTRSKILWHCDPLRRRRCSTPLLATAESREGSQKLEQWDSLTAKFAGTANIPFLLLQLPQIVLNAQNLLSGNKAALTAVPWLGMLTGLLGNLSLLSYFAKKRETEAMLVQTLGVISTYMVLLQLAMAEAMPAPQFIAMSVVVAAGLVLNFLNYFGYLHDRLWRLWEDFIMIGGVAVLPQVMWSTFVPYIPKSMLPGIICCVTAVAAVILARTGKFSDNGMKFVGSISGWTATLLFMWMPVAQMWTNYLNPENIRGLSAFTMVLAMIGNGLMIPRALFIRDLMWFSGSIWATLFYGWGNLLCMYCFKSIGKEFILAATLGLFLWIGMALWRDTVAYGYNTPFRSLRDLFFEH